jgi:pyruvate,water dikinase
VNGDQNTVWLCADGTATPGEVGGKAYGLQQLATFGLPTAPAFALTVAAHHRYMDAAGLSRTVEPLLQALPDSRAREQLEATAFAADWPSELQHGLAKALARLINPTGSKLLAVRSSAIDEDGAERSFAGQHDTVLGVVPDGVETAVRVCWASLWSERAIAYRRAHGIAYPNSQMAVVVQELVDATRSAIAFSLDPVSGRRDRVMITVTHGLGEPIVSGTVNPDTAVLAKHSLELVSYHEGDKAVCVRPRPAGGVTRLRAHGEGHAADLNELQELASLVIDAERCLGRPADVEAARDASGWRLVQLRPALIMDSSQHASDGHRRAAVTARSA